MAAIIKGEPESQLMQNSLLRYWEIADCVMLWWRIYTGQPERTVEIGPPHPKPDEDARTFSNRYALGILSISKVMGGEI